MTCILLYLICLGFCMLCSMHKSYSFVKLHKLLSYTETKYLSVEEPDKGSMNLTKQTFQNYLKPQWKEQIMTKSNYHDYSVARREKPHMCIWPLNMNTEQNI